MTRRLLISERAEADLRSIWQWTYDEFGETQADRYLDQLDEGLRRCGTQPEDGKDRGALRAGYRSMLVRKHVVFYTFTDKQVLIQRVLHGSMDLVRTCLRPSAQTLTPPLCVPCPPRSNPSR